LMIFTATEFSKIAPEYGARHKSCSLEICSKTSPQMFVKTEQHLLCHLLYDGGFAHCTYWLVKLHLCLHTSLQLGILITFVNNLCFNINCQ
jgi:hypothetical protein